MVENTILKKAGASIKPCLTKFETGKAVTIIKYLGCCSIMKLPDHDNESAGATKHCHDFT